MNYNRSPRRAFRNALATITSAILLASASAQQTGSDAALTELDVFTITGYREGRNMALQQQRDAANRLDVISADRVGQLPDKNIADAVSRLPGVSLIGDDGEGRFVSIRGLNPNLNNVTINGATIASPGIRNLDGRDNVSSATVPLDIMGSAQLAAIEVVKTVTPDMDANAIGGSINLRSVSGFDYDERTFFGSVGIGQARLVGDEIYDIDFSYVDLLDEDRLAIALSASFSRRPFKLEALQTVWIETTDSQGRQLPQQLELLPEWAERDRFGLTGNIEYRPTTDSEYYLRFNYNRFDEDWRRNESVFRNRDGLGMFVGEQAFLYTDNGRIRADVDADSHQTKQTQINLTAGFKRTFGNLTVEPKVGYSYAAYDNPNNSSLRFRNNNIQSSGMLIDWSGFQPTIDLGTNTLMNLDNYQFNRWTMFDYRIRDTIWTPQIDLTWRLDEFMGADAATIKTGLKFFSQDRHQRANVFRHSGGSLRLGHIPNAITTPGSSNQGNIKPFDVNEQVILDFMRNNPGTINPNEVFSRNRTASDTFWIDSDILAAYVMGTLEFGNLTIIAGLRYEDTDVTLRGLEHQLQGGQPGPFVQNSTSFSYDHLFPNLQFKYQVNPALILRGAFTMTLSRPEYEFATPSSVLQVEEPPGLDPEFPFEGSINIGNPELQPYESRNFDFGIEYYFENSSMVMASLFHKKVDNPIYPFSNEFNREVRRGFAFDTLSESSFANADEATVRGIEFAAFVPFTFLPAPFDGFGLDGNIAFVSSKVTVPQRPEPELPFFEQPDRIFNVSLFYERGRVAARVAYAHQSASLREIRNLPQLNLYRAGYGQLDAQASYQISDRLSVFANGQNITRQAQNTFMGTPDKMRYSRQTGANYRAGLRFRF